ncbi:MAG TPA: hypothetical protein VEI07_14280, partial [Planctomycetaceae bacterium]|nr:hypothetical protein [Planctomycetaceae bacterium]
SDAPPDRSSQDPVASAGVHHHRRHPHKPTAPVDATDARASDSHPGDPVALRAEHKDAGHAGDFGDHTDAVRHDVQHDLPPVDHQVKAVPQEIPHDPKHEADAALDSLLAAPVASSAPHHDDKATPLAQTEPPPSGDFDKPAHPHHASEPLLVDSRDPAPALPEKREHLKQSAASEPLSDDFGSPDARKHEHHEAKDHGPKDSGLKDDFAMPAPAAAPVDSQPPIDDAHAHKHHHSDRGPGDSLPGGDLAAPPAGQDTDVLAPKLDAPLPDAAHSKPPAGDSGAHRANDPLLDVGPNLDGPPKEAHRDTPIKPSDDRPAHKHNHPEDGPPVLSVPSAHHHDAKLPDDAPKTDSHQSDDLGPPMRTANVSDAPIGGPADSGKSLPPKPPETKAPAGKDADLDDLLNSKVPDRKAPEPKPAGGSAAGGFPAGGFPAPHTTPAAAPNDDPFHTEPAPHGDGKKLDVAPKGDIPKLDAPSRLDTAPKAELAPKVEIAPKHSEPVGVSEEEMMPSVAVAHHQIEKDETGASVRYKIVVRNNGKKAVKAFEVDEAIPAEHAVQVTDPPAETRDQDLHWTLHNVAPGEERTIVVTLVPPARPAEHPHATPIPEPTVVVQPIPVASALHDAASPESPQLKLELITPVEVHAGETCRIGFRATNLGSKAPDLKLNLDLPDQLRYTRGQRLQYKIGALGDHESREDYLTATAAGTGQVELRAEILQAGHSIASAKGKCQVSPAAAHRGIQQTGGWAPTQGAAVRLPNGADCLCWP